MDMLGWGVRVGLGVDGSASNDGSHMLGEARQALLAARVREGMTGFSRSDDPARKLMTARQALEIGTRGGAAVLGRPDLGSLEPGKCADFFAVNLNRLEYAGALHDPVAAIVFCAPVRADMMVVGGKMVVKEGQLTGVELGRLVEAHNRAAKRLVNG
jgi:cytosine/adenosine deaminase-related metal-dependent hydrolase